MAGPVNDWLRYTHLEKLYGYLPGMADALPGIFGLTSQEYDTQRTAYSDAARRVAADLVRDDPQVAKLVDAIPIAAGQHILAVGDSITDDLQSWAEILRHLIQLRRPGDGITLINGGLSAHTTAMILRRWTATLTAASPDLIICALGGNDVTRVGPSAHKTRRLPRGVDRQPTGAAPHRGRDHRGDLGMDNTSVRVGRPRRAALPVPVRGIGVAQRRHHPARSGNDRVPGADCRSHNRVRGAGRPRPPRRRRGAPNPGRAARYHDRPAGDSERGERTYRPTVELKSVSR